MSQHTEACHAATEAWRAEAAAYDAAYPGWCRTCGAAGGRAYHGTLETPPEWDECHDCVGQGRCPRCASGQPGLLDDPSGFTCPSCGWDCGHGMRPDGPECYGECIDGDY